MTISQTPSAVMLASDSETFRTQPSIQETLFSIVKLVQSSEVAESLVKIDKNYIKTSFKVKPFIMITKTAHSNNKVSFKVDKMRNPFQA